MDTLKNAFKQSGKYWVIIAIILLTAFIYLITQPKADGFLWLTPFHAKPFDYFFMVYTYLGDGIFILSLVVILALVKRKLLALAVLFSYCLSGILAQILKNIFPMPRPFVYFHSLGRDIYKIPGVTLTASHASFPSGHTTSAFALLTILLLFFPKNRWNALFVLLTLLVGYSRMYLDNHFLFDVFSGAILGIIGGIGAFELTKKILNAKPQWFV
jgi:membrane-associated phospholipid phosphatase